MTEVVNGLTYSYILHCSLNQALGLTCTTSGHMAPIPFTTTARSVVINSSSIHNDCSISQPAGQSERLLRVDESKGFTLLQGSLTGSREVAVLYTYDRHSMAVVYDTRCELFGSCGGCDGCSGGYISRFDDCGAAVTGIES